MGAGAATVRRSADAEDEHGEGCNSQNDLDVLAIDLAGEQGDFSEFVHGIPSFYWFVMLEIYNLAGFKTGFKIGLKKQQKSSSFELLFELGN
jgi:hypothetical protein